MTDQAEAYLEQTLDQLIAAINALVEEWKRYNDEAARKKAEDGEE